MNTTEYEDLENVGIKFITNGETETLQCEDKWTFANFVLVECNDGKPKISKCKYHFKLYFQMCLKIKRKITRFSAMSLIVWS